MEVKKAIEIIEKFGIDYRGYPALEKAVNVVLEYTKAQLSQEDTTKDAASDLISRRAAIDALYHVDEYNGRSIETIRNLPSAQPEPERTMEEFMYGQDMGNPEDGSL